MRHLISSAFIILTIVLCPATLNSQKSDNGDNETAHADIKSIIDIITYGTLIVFHEAPPSLLFPNLDRLILYHDIPDSIRVMEYTNPRGLYTETYAMIPNRVTVGQWKLNNDTLQLYPSLYLHPATKYFPRDSFVNIISRQIPPDFADAPPQRLLIRSEGLYNITDYTDFYRQHRENWDYEYRPNLTRPIFRLKTYCTEGEVNFN